MGIYDEDKAYMISLMNHINSDRENPFLAMAFSGQEELRCYLHENSLDVLIIDEKLYANIWQELEAQRCVILSGERRFETKEISGAAVLFKYSRSSDIVQGIIKYMDVDVPERRRRLFRSYGVISPIGRCGKTNRAISLCMGDEVRGGLYIGMEEFSSFYDREDVISNTIYLVKERAAGFTEYVDAHTVKLDDYSVLGYMRSYLDAMELTGEDVRWMIDKFREWCRYTTVVFDIGQAVLKDLTVLSAFDMVIIPELSDEQSQEKISTFERLLESVELGKVAKRMRRVRVPNAAPGSAEMLRFIDSQVVDKW